MEEAISQKIYKLKNEIIDLADDKEKVGELLVNLLDLQKEADVEPMEISVPCSDVIEEEDFGAWRIASTKRGALIELKGGMTTFVDMRMKSVYEMLVKTLLIKKQEQKTDEDRELAESYASAIGYVFQAPIFASMSAEMLYDMALFILKQFNANAQQLVSEAVERMKSEDNYAKDIEQQKVIDAFEQMLASMSKDIPADEQSK